VTTQLAPCPFCGEQPVIEYTPPNWTGVYGGKVYCDGCLIEFDAPTREDAIAAWNNRVPAAVPVEAIRALAGYVARMVNDDDGNDVPWSVDDANQRVRAWLDSQEAR
jgi:Lar family restriction alleviation protein